jgi:hypothetical protein
MRDVYLKLTTCKMSFIIASVSTFFPQDREYNRIYGHSIVGDVNQEAESRVRVDPPHANWYLLLVVNPDNENFP